MQQQQIDKELDLIKKVKKERLHLVQLVLLLAIRSHLWPIQLLQKLVGTTGCAGALFITKVGSLLCPFLSSCSPKVCVYALIVLSGNGCPHKINSTHRLAYTADEKTQTGQGLGIHLKKPVSTIATPPTNRGRCCHVLHFPPTSTRCASWRPVRNILLLLIIFLAGAPRCVARFLLVGSTSRDLSMSWSKGVRC